MKPTIGIIGGMGPLATCDMMRKIIVFTDVKSDQENFRIVVDNNTEIPDRTEAILEGGESPVPQILRSALGLQDMGADVLLMACNTAHYFYDSIVPSLDVPVLHMIRETAADLKRNGIVKAGLLATDGTVRSGIYHRALKEAGIELVCPDEAGQRAVMGIAYDGVKACDASYDVSGFLEAVEALQRQGAQTMILGCTELPVAMDVYGMAFESADPTEILAHAAVDFCRQLERE